jgi:hypothetical protein
VGYKDRLWVMGGIEVQMFFIVCLQMHFNSHVSHRKLECNVSVWTCIPHPDYAQKMKNFISQSEDDRPNKEIVKRNIFFHCDALSPGTSP